MRFVIEFDCKSAEQIIVQRECRNCLDFNLFTEQCSWLCDSLMFQKQD
jgi:hypothetical protein